MIRTRGAPITATRAGIEGLSEKGMATLRRIEALQRFLPSGLSRDASNLMMGETYKGVRKIYEALGYPDEEDLTFSYFYDRWDRQDIATAIIDKPVEATWANDLIITEEGIAEEDSSLFVAWRELDKQFKIKKTFARLDVLDGIGQYSLLLFGFNDVKNKAGFEKQAGGITLKLNYIKAIPESNSKILKWETDSSNDRFGKPLLYEIEVGQPAESGRDTFITKLRVHHSRILHIASGSLVSDIYGRSRLRPVINRLLDLEKIMGGDAEMFWRGARPGYHAKPDEGFAMGATEEAALDEELDKFEHDLRRIIYAKGIDLKALDMQISDPKNHVEIQHEAISAETGIPKRILTGSERGELSSSQDREQWLTLITNRRKKYAEIEILEPFIDKCMQFQILPETEYVIVWSDLFAPSEKEKADVGKVRAEAISAYFTNPLAMEMIPIDIAMKYLIGLNKDQLKEFMEKVDEAALEEDRSMAGTERILELEQQRQLNE